jgi:MFS family permease
VDEPQPGRAVPGPLRRIPVGIWALGLGSMFMDISSELVHSLLPLFMIGVLGASMVTVGVVEGVAEATAAIVKVFSGALSDYLGKRKFLLVLGYSLAALTKPVFPLATAMSWVFLARFVDRVGKGIREAPRDALIAETVPSALRGAAYGLRQALDSVGAFLGPLLAMALMAWLASEVKAVMWFAVPPAFIAVALLAVAVHEPERKQGGSAERPRLATADARRLPASYWLVVLLGAAFTLARFSEAFLILRAQDVGLALALVPGVMVVMNVVYAAIAFPAGAAADRRGAHGLLLVGLATLVAADLVLAAATSPLAVFAGAALWGIHMGLTQGLLSKLVADTAPGDLLGTAFGVFNLVSGVALLLASVIAGALWSGFGAPATFIAGAAFAAIAALGLAAYRRPARAQP